MGNNRSLSLELACKMANVPFQSPESASFQYVNSSSEHSIAASRYALDNLHKDKFYWGVSLKGFDVVYFCFSLINRPSCNEIIKVGFVLWWC